MWIAEGRDVSVFDADKLRDVSSVLRWRRERGREHVEAENAAWLLDHPGDPLPEHLCSLDGTAKGAEYDKWRATWEAENAWRFWYETPKQFAAYRKWLADLGVTAHRKRGKSCSRA